MRLISACLAFSLTALVAAAAPALAGDLNNSGAGGIKDYAAGGVPAPMPQAYEENFKWYLRGDIGTAFKSTGKISNDGLAVNLYQPDQWHELSILSLGFGKYVTPNLRVEYTMDYRPGRQVSQNNKAVSDTSLRFVSAAEVDINSYHGVQAEYDKYQNTTFLMSAFYDFNRGGRFHPYVGAGAGLAMHQLSRNGANTYTCYDSGSSVTLIGPPVTLIPGCSTNNGLQTSYTVTSNTTSIGYGLAAQLSAGLSYDLSHRVHWDTGYRMLWQSGHVTAVSSDGLSSVTLGDHIDHEVRTGVRWDLW